MKFGKQLERHKVHGWGAFYVDYDGLKRILESRTAVFAAEVQPREDWLLRVEQSVERVNAFFTGTADEVEARLDAAESELDNARSLPGNVKEHLQEHLEYLVAELQVTVTNLGHFSAANYTALYKIFKKHDKLTKLQVLPIALRQVTDEPFHEPGKVRLEGLQRRLSALGKRLGLDADLELVGAREWASGGQDTWALARLSFSLGVTCMAWAVLAVLYELEPLNDGYSAEALAATIPVFRVLFMVNLTFWLAGGCALVCERFKINYLFLLDISPEQEVRAISLLNFASVQTGIWIVVVFLFLADVKFNVPLHNVWHERGHLEAHTLAELQTLAHTYPASLLVLQLAVSCCWISISNRSFFALLCKVCLMLPGPVTFAENIFADFLTSFSRPLKDLAYSVCYIRSSRTMDLSEVRSMCRHPTGLPWYCLQLIVVAPLVIRTVQCLRRIHDTKAVVPHIYNAFKYFTALLVSLLAGARLMSLGLSKAQAMSVHIAGYLVATTYSAVWDLVMDFGLANPDRRCLFPRFVYAVVAVLDVLLRLTWTLTFLPDCQAFVSASHFNSECFAFGICALELLRRALWAIVRLEHEHLSNAGRFRSVCWVPPLEQLPKQTAGARSPKNSPRRRVRRRTLQTPLPTVAHSSTMIVPLRKQSDPDVLGQRSFSLPDCEVGAESWPDAKLEDDSALAGCSGEPYGFSVESPTAASPRDGPHTRSFASRILDAFAIQAGLKGTSFGVAAEEDASKSREPGASQASWPEDPAAGVQRAPGENCPASTVAWGAASHGGERLGDKSPWIPGHALKATRLEDLYGWAASLRAIQW